VKDFAISDNPVVQAQLDRLGVLALPQGRFGLETIRALLTRLGDPQKHIPPAFHVAWTNGKGSTCAFLRAMLEAQGLTVHAATKPHLVRYNERIRIAGLCLWPPPPPCFAWSPSPVNGRGVPTAGCSARSLREAGEGATATRYRWAVRPRE